MAEELKRLAAARGQAKGAITRLFRFSADPDAKRAPRSEIIVKRDRLQKTFMDYCDYNVEISTLDQTNAEDFDETEEKYYKALAFFESLLAPMEARDAVDSACKLPPIALNKFSGEVSDYTDFITLFKSVIDCNNSLSNCTKFYHLKALLIGEPAHIIQHLQLTAENYVTALQLLDDRYNNKSRLVNLHINALLDLKQITKTSAPALRDLVSKTRQHVGALKNLEIPAQYWDAILIAILQRKIDPYSLRCYHLEQKDNLVPNLNTFLNFLDQRASALETVADTSQVQPSVQLNQRRASLVTAGKHSPDKPVLCNYCQSGVWSLKNLSISVPRAVLSGEGQAAVLRCSYDLEGAALYSIRWYRAETEFYRYVPRELPPSMVFPLPGASVDLTQSDENQVRIVNLNRRLSGDYQCEVSADAPLFHTDIRSAPLTVVDPPFRAPRLTVSRGNYARGDVIRAHCSVDEAYPAPNITWILDEHKIAETIPEPVSELDFTERGASSQLEITVLETEQYRVGLTYTSASLARAYRDYGDEKKNRTTVRYTLVPPASGQFELGCVSTILDIYARKSEPVTVREDAPHPASVTGEDSKGAAVSCSLFLLACACAGHVL